MKAHSIIVRPSNAQEMNVIKAFFEALKINYEVADDSPYNSEFVAKIEKSRKQAAEGKTVKVDLDDIWK
ncbi:MAG: hypothetical protein R6U85_00440 [Salinivirgaceae bacterium]